VIYSKMGLSELFLVVSTSPSAQSITFVLFPSFFLAPTVMAGCTILIPAGFSP